MFTYNLEEVVTLQKYFRVYVRYFLILVVIILLQSCYLGLEYSPYSTEVDYENLNKENIARIKALESKSNNYRIALIADTHRFYTETEKAINILNAQKDLDFVFILGDITDIGLLWEYNIAYEIFSKLDYPFIVIVGNHEFLGNGETIYKKMYGPLNFHFTFRGTEFICFNNNNWESGEPDWAWLEQTASSSNAAYKILLAHIDCSQVSERFNQTQVDTFNNIVKSYFDLVFHAHDHIYSMKQIDNVPRYHVGSPQNSIYVILEYNDHTHDFSVEPCTF
ncbi:MAG: metallophosphoesterase [Spirochaetes bacterium]|nr:metallophosphoesterase [Spirochaetota bacterium]